MAGHAIVRVFLRLGTRPIRRWAVRNLQVASTEDVALLSSALRDSAPDVRAAALASLGRCLLAPSHLVRHEATWVLLESDEPDASGHLGQALRELTPEVREAVLGRAVTKSAAADERVGRKLIALLAESDDPGVVRHLVDALDSGGLRSAAADALLKQDRAAVIQALEAKMDGSALGDRCAASLLQRLGRRPADADSRLRLKWLHALGDWAGVVQAGLDDAPAFRELLGACWERLGQLRTWAREHRGDTVWRDLHEDALASMGELVDLACLRAGERATDLLGNRPPPPDLLLALVQRGGRAGLCLIKRGWDRGYFDHVDPPDRELVKTYLHDRRAYTIPIEDIGCALCSERRPVTSMRRWGSSGEESWFCESSCWPRRGQVVGSRHGVSCPYYSDGLCGTGPDAAGCSHRGGSHEGCPVYRVRADGPAALIERLGGRVIRV